MKKKRNALIFAGLCILASLSYMAKPHYLHKYSAGECLVAPEALSVVEIKDTPFLNYSFIVHNLFMGSSKVITDKIKNFHRETDALVSDVLPCTDISIKAE